MGCAICSGQNRAEYKLKAAFIYNFVQFIEWPQEAFVSSNAPIVIAILGTDPFGNSLQEIVTGEKVGLRPLQIVRGKTLQEIGTCHLLYVSASEKDEVANILQRVGNLPIFTVSDLENFAERGGMARFFVEQNKLRYEINLQAARQGNLKISSKLLRLARIVGPQQTP
jgi:hypothetical protein